MEKHTIAVSKDETVTITINKENSLIKFITFYLKGENRITIETVEDHDQTDKG